MGTIVGAGEAGNVSAGMEAKEMGGVDVITSGVLAGVTSP
jgi:hypothetical protein